MDTVDKQTRSRIMGAVGQKNTGPEMRVRRALHKLGVRYRLHDRSLAGSPDLTFPRFRAVVFVHGCYWHSHGCSRSTVPKSREDFWLAKFEANRARDMRNIERLRAQGWRILIVWECALKGKGACEAAEIAKQINNWLHSTDRLNEIAGKEHQKTL